MIMLHVIEWQISCQPCFVSMWLMPEECTTWTLFTVSGRFVVDSYHLRAFTWDTKNDMNQVIWHYPGTLYHRMWKKISVLNVKDILLYIAQILIGHLHWHGTSMIELRRKKTSSNCIASLMMISFYNSFLFAHHKSHFSIFHTSAYM